MPSKEELAIILSAQDKATKTIQGVGESLQTIMSLGKVGVAAKGVQELFTRYFDLGETAAELVNLQRGYSRMAERIGADSQQLLVDMGEMSAGMMSNARLMQEWSRAYVMAGEDVAREFPRLIKIASAVSAQGLVDFDWALQSLTIGIGRMERRWIDNLGIIVDNDTAMRNYAATVGKSVDELTDAEKQMAFLDETERVAIERLGDLDQVQDKAGKSILQFRATMENLTNTLKVSVLPDIEAFADSLNDIAVVAMPVIEAYNKLRGAQREFATSGEGAAGAAQKVVWLMGPMAQALLMAVTGSYKLGQELGRRLAPGLDAAGNAADYLKAEMYLASGAMAEATGSAEQLIRTLRRMTTIGIGVSGIIEDLREANIRYEKAVAGATEPWRKEYPQGLLGTFQYAVAMREWQTDQYIETQRAMSQADERGASSAASAAGDAQQAWESYFSNYRSGLEAIMQPTMPFDLDKTLDELGLHENKWDEWARRMATLLGEPLKSPWLQELKPEWVGLPEEQIKGLAAQEIGAFYRFEKPEMIDVEAIARDFERAMTTEVNYQNVMNMVAEQMQAAGLGPMTELAMTAFEGPFTQGGVDAADDFWTSFSGYDVAPVAQQNMSSYKAAITAAAKDPTLKSSIAAAIFPSYYELWLQAMRQYQATR